jgi:Redoxin
MRIRADITVAAIVILLAGYAVAVQLGSDPFASEAPEVIEPIDVGERLEVDFTLSDVDDVPKPRNLMAWYGTRATVLYTWSVPCPCVDKVEERLRTLHARYDRRNAGVEWVALAGEPNDTREMVRRKLEHLQAFYRLLLDPDQRVCRRLGLVQAAMVAVLDGDGRLVYRGAIDADYEHGHAEFLAEALAAVVEGRPVPVPERPWVYGCEFNVPESCLQYQRDAAAASDEDARAPKRP